MGSFDWGRPRYRLRGKATESVGGENLLREVAAPRIQPSKAELRAQAEAALQQWRDRHPAPDDVDRAPATTSTARPPWEE